MFSRRKKVTELPSFRATELTAQKNFRRQKSYQVTGMKIIFFLPPAKMLSSYQATTSAKKFPEEKSYQATKLLSYRVTGAGINFRQKKSYQATELSY